MAHAATGTADGDELACGLGALVGDAEGCAVGTGVGTVQSHWVGATVGAAVGAVVGVKLERHPQPQGAWRVSIFTSLELNAL